MEGSGAPQFPPPPPPQDYGPGQMPPGAFYGGASGPRASFGRRLVAYILDGIIIDVPALILIAIGGGFDTTTTDTGGVQSSNTALLIIGYATLFLGSILYYAAFEGSRRGQTLGKRALGIRVVDAHTGGPIGFWRALLRAFGRIVSGALCDLGYLWMLWDREKQCWHDKMATDYVVPVSAYPIGPAPS